MLNQNQKQKLSQKKSKNNILLEYIKASVKDLLVEKQQKKKSDEIKTLARIGLVAKKFPGVKKALEELMSPSFAYYVKDIHVISPKPTTFKVTLNNDLDFDLTYSNKSFSAKIAGKKYYLLNLGESERASTAITQLLSLSPTKPQDQGAADKAAADQGLASDFNSMGGGAGVDPASGLPELQPEQVPTEEVPGVGPTGGAAPGGAAAAGGGGSPNPTP